MRAAACSLLDNALSHEGTRAHTRTTASVATFPSKGCGRVRLQQRAASSCCSRLPAAATACSLINGSLGKKQRINSEGADQPLGNYPPTPPNPLDSHWNPNYSAQLRQKLPALCKSGTVFVQSLFWRARQQVQPTVAMPGHAPPIA